MYDVNFWLAILGSSTHCIRKLGEYSESWENFESEICAICAKVLILNLTLFHLTLTWLPSKVKFDDVIGSNAHHYRRLHAKWSRKLVSHSMLVTFFWWPFVTWPWLSFFALVKVRSFRSVRAVAGPGGVVGPLPRPKQRWANHRKTSQIGREFDLDFDLF